MKSYKDKLDRKQCMGLSERSNIYVDLAIGKDRKVIYDSGFVFFSDEEDGECNSECGRCDAREECENSCFRAYRTMTSTEIIFNS